MEKLNISKGILIGIIVGILIVAGVVTGILYLMGILVREGGSGYIDVRVHNEWNHDNTVNIWIDGKQMETITIPAGATITSGLRYSAPVGSHTIEAVPSWGNSDTVTIEVKNGETTHVYLVVGG